MSKRKNKVQVIVSENPPLLKEFKPRTINQNRYIKTIINSDITICTGPAGTGKSAIAVGAATQFFHLHKVEKIVIARPIIEASFKSMGALPGDIREKTNPYIRPVYEELVGYFGTLRTERLIKDGYIEICPLEMMRGRTFNESIIILDEAQNATFEQLIMFSTRLGHRSKSIINGDIGQSDLPYQYVHGFPDFVNMLTNVDGIGIIELDKSDNQRHPTVRNILDILERYNETRNERS